MPDLKKMLTLEALSEALPSWLKRSTKPEYNADEIDSTLTTNQFVTASDKDNWNAKGTYSKPSGGIPKSDLSSIVQTSLEKADSALQSETDPTVPSWAKQSSKPSYTQDEVSDGSTYKRVTQTEKDAWSGKQNALTTTQMQAVNSGITSANLAQIIRNGVKNQLKLTGTVYNPNTLIVIWDYENGTLRVTGSIATTSTVFINLGSWTAPEDGVYRLYANAEACTANIRVYDDALWNTYENAGGGASDEATWTKGTTRTLYLRIANGVVVGDITVTPMICQKSVFDADPSFAPYAAPNNDLTLALAEVIDAGAKQKINPISGTGSNVTITWSDTGVAVSGTPSGSQYAYVRIGTVSLKAGEQYVLIDPDYKSAHYAYLDHHTATSVDSPTFREYPTIVTANTTGTYNIFMRFNSGTAITATHRPMLCTLADWRVSQKFVPFTKSNYELTQYTDGCSLDTVSKSSGSLDDITQNSFAVYNASVTGKPVDNEGNTSAFTGLCKTDVYNSSEAMQTLTRLSNGHRWVRTKTAGTWNPWAQLGASCTTYSITPTAINTWTEVTRITIPANCIVKITASIGWDQDPVSGIKLTNESGTLLAINEDRSSANLGGLTLTHIENTKGMSSGYTRVLYGEISRISGGGRTRVTVTTEYVEC